MKRGYLHETTHLKHFYFLSRKTLVECIRGHDCILLVQMSGPCASTVFCQCLNFMTAENVEKEIHTSVSVLLYEEHMVS